MSEPSAACVFGGAGGSAMGLKLAGFGRVVVVDNNPKLAAYMPPGVEFVCMDGFEFLAEHGREFTLIEAGPPCQRKSRMTNCRPGLAAEYPNLVKPVRIILDHLGVPYVIENVVGSDVRPDLLLCGSMFGLPLYRHRVYEFGHWPHLSTPQPPAHPRHVIPASKAGHWRPGTIISVSGHVSPIAEAKRAMDISWMTRDQLAEAIPPPFTRFIGEAFVAAISERNAA